jgi:hypothetical protein
MLPRKKTLEPDSDVTSSPASPPVHDSAIASVASCAFSDLATADGNVSPSTP